MREVIEIRNLTKVFAIGFWGSKVTAVADLSLSVAEGNIYGFLGPNGAGKTTTIKVLLGLIFPSSGEVFIFGKSPLAPEVKSRIGFLPEHPSFYDYLTGREFLNFYAQMFGIRRQERKDKVQRLLKKVGISNAADIQLRKYSKGMIQRIGIAQALLNDPDLIILDEPMSGLDPLGRIEVRDLIFSLKEMGKTVFFSSHILSDVEVICDHVAIISEGRLVEVHDQVAQNDKHLEARFLELFKKAE